MMIVYGVNSISDNDVYKKYLLTDNYHQLTTYPAMYIALHLTNHTKSNNSQSHNQTPSISSIFLDIFRDLKDLIQQMSAHIISIIQLKQIESRTQHNQLISGPPLQKNDTESALGNFHYGALLSPAKSIFTHSNIKSI